MKKFILSFMILVSGIFMVEVALSSFDNKQCDDFLEAPVLPNPLNLPSISEEVEYILQNKKNELHQVLVFFIIEMIFCGKIPVNSPLSKLVDNTIWKIFSNNDKETLIMFARELEEARLIANKDFIDQFLPEIYNYIKILS